MFFGKVSVFTFSFWLCSFGLFFKSKHSRICMLFFSFLNFLVFSLNLRHLTMDNNENSEPDFKTVHPVTFYFIFRNCYDFSGLTFVSTHSMFV